MGIGSFTVPIYTNSSGATATSPRLYEVLAVYMPHKSAPDAVERRVARAFSTHEAAPPLPKVGAASPACRSGAAHWCAPGGGA